MRNMPSTAVTPRQGRPPHENLQSCRPLRLFGVHSIFKVPNPLFFHLQIYLILPVKNGKNLGLRLPWAGIIRYTAEWSVQKRENLGLGLPGAHHPLFCGMSKTSKSRIAPTVGGHHPLLCRMECHKIAKKSRIAPAHQTIVICRIECYPSL